MGRTPHPNDETDLGAEANPASARFGAMCLRRNAFKSERTGHYGQRWMWDGN